MDIIQVGDPVLRSRSEIVINPTSVRYLADEMVRILQSRGVGLAAPQVGHAFRLIVIDIKKSELFPHRPEVPLKVMVNPEIQPVNNEVEIDWEGCLSISNGDLLGLVPRYKDVKGTYITLEGV